MRNRILGALLPLVILWTGIRPCPMDRRLCETRSASHAECPFHRRHRQAPGARPCCDRPPRAHEPGRVDFSAALAAAPAALPDVETAAANPLPFRAVRPPEDHDPPDPPPPPPAFSRPPPFPLSA